MARHKQLFDRQYDDFLRVFQRALRMTFRLRVRLGAEELARYFAASMNRMSGAVNNVQAIDLTPAMEAASTQSVKRALSSGGSRYSRRSPSKPKYAARPSA